MSEQSPTRPSIGAGAVLAAAVLWGTVGPAQVLASTPADPVLLGAARLLVGGLVIGAAVPLLDGRRRPGPSSSRWQGSALRRGSVPWRGVTARWLLTAAVATAIYQAAFLSSVHRTGAALATVVALGVAPPAVGLAARLLTAEPLTRTWFAATVTAVAGTALLLVPSGDAAAIDPLGVLLGVLGGVCYGLYTVSAKQLLAGPAPTFTAVAVTLVLGGLLVLPFASAPLTALTDLRTLGLITWLAIPATAGAYVLFVRGLRHVSAAQAGTLSLAEPLVAALLGLLLLGEHLPAVSAAGAAILTTGLTLACLPPSHRPPPEPVVPDIASEHSACGGCRGD